MEYMAIRTDSNGKNHTHFGGKLPELIVEVGERDACGEIDIYEVTRDCLGDVADAKKLCSVYVAEKEDQ